MRCKMRLLCGALGFVIALSAFNASEALQSRGARHRKSRLEVCFDPTVPCRTSVAFQPYALPFRVPKNVVIHDTELFYAVILKRVRLGSLDCDKFISEKERLSAQALFPHRKVFTSRRCDDGGEVGYRNPNGTDATDYRGGASEFMAVYAGKTRAEAEKTLAGVRVAGRFPTANIQRMRAGFNGT